MEAQVYQPTNMQAYIMVLWVVTLRNLVNGYLSTRETNCPVYNLLLSNLAHFYPEDESSISLIKKGKIGKAIRVTGHEGPQGCETLRLPYFV
jgi:hypothetical protein